MHKHDLPLMLTLCLYAVGFSSLFDGHCTCDDGSHYFFGDELQKFFFVLWRGVECASADDMHFFETSDLRINGGILSAEIADKDNAPLLSARFDAGAERSADEFDHKIDATHSALYGLSHILLFV